MSIRLNTSSRLGSRRTRSRSFLSSFAGIAVGTAIGVLAVVAFMSLSESDLQEQIETGLTCVIKPLVTDELGGQQAVDESWRLFPGVPAAPAVVLKKTSISMPFFQSAVAGEVDLRVGQNESDLSASEEQSEADLDVDQLVRKAEAGDVAAMNRLAAAYFNGDVVDRDLSKSLEYLGRAAEKGGADVPLLRAIHKELLAEYQSSQNTRAREELERRQEERRLEDERKKADIALQNKRMQEMRRQEAEEQEAILAAIRTKAEQEIKAEREADRQLRIAKELHRMEIQAQQQSARERREIYDDAYRDGYSDGRSDGWGRYWRYDDYDHGRRRRGGWRSDGSLTMPPMRPSTPNRVPESNKPEKRIITIKPASPARSSSSGGKYTGSVNPTKPRPARPAAEKTPPVIPGEIPPGGIRRN